ncbi:PAS domain-containing protein [Zunongwangia sp. F260]|uniref:PAS domain-containing protein n=1 Tax=Autumnicola lenta TaxID=3075593 RepID=A0ABU3CJP5_9FLAO|nr:GAF domain-containing protein [Zunongwangia sp. F260]MDT0646453.1 PAS domain-containing protein [Zunongwangia sp. F260]
MNESERIKELQSYNLLKGSKEKILDELVEIASLVCNVPISLITLVGKDTQNFLVHRGLSITQTSRKDSFCRHTLHQPEEILIVPDSLKDERFKNNVLVKGDPHIRFYAGAPLETPNGNVLGTLCVIDTKPKKISENQKKALKILAKKAMDHLNDQKMIHLQKQQIESHSDNLLKLTDEIPGMIYQCKMTEEGEMSFHFISKGLELLSPEITREQVYKDPHLIFTLIHEEDLPRVQKKIQKSFENLRLWEHEFRIINKENTIEWRKVKAIPQKQNDNSVIWYGFIQDYTKEKAYQNKMEKLAFDISHVLRKPVATLLSLTSILENHTMDAQEINEYNGYIKQVSEELDAFTKELYRTYADGRDTPKSVPDEKVTIY